jgi:histidinol-phosphatase
MPQHHSSLSGPELSSLLEFAVEIADSAGELTLPYFGGTVASSRKGDGTPVTMADREAERHLREKITRRFPHHGILGEELGQTDGRPGQPRWILDPIDGTRSFMKGVPLYAVLVALIVDDQPVLGAIRFPALQETVAAAQGQGCYLNGAHVSVSAVTEMDQAVALLSDPGMMARSPVASGWAELQGRVDYTRSWGDAYGHAMVATGRAEIMVDPDDLKVWDAAPLLPIITEAGGRFTTLNAEATIWGGSGVSTNGHLHRQALAILEGEEP